ncbi:single-stranded DNA binding protein [Halomicroarcula sp. F28]|uniref:single-stranded DNA binding protein n=1 Tax=Haloarcula salinisoli TaxID=2487746 RepID=UPI001C72D532|nr:single-stranded DNA binding protein [Halomicroarcula salinisoli]MBX0287211.1 single-stranded DNA binding protein [Halomicroarcula salinisoli]
MGEIADIYADLETDVSEEEFREAVEEKVEQMGGLADEETAAMLLAHELNEGEVETIADIEPGMDEVKFIAKVMAIGDLKTFEREGEDEDGRVINVEAADETASVRLAFWDGQAVDIDDGMLSVGDVLRVKGRPKDGYNGLEVSVDKAEQDDDATVDVEPGDGSTVEALTMGQSDVTLRGLVLDTDSVRTFDRDDGSEGKVSNLTLGDETGRVRVTMWDDRADRATEIEPGTAVEVVDGYVREREGSLELHVGDDGAVDEIDEAVDFQPDADPIDGVEIEQTVDIAGVVRSADPVRTFDRDDGSEGQVRNIRIQDATGDIRVALWGDKADKDIQPGDEVLAADVEIQDGWQDDLEASASWNSTIVVLDDGASPAPTPEEQADDQHAGLSSFGDGEDSEASATGGGESTATADTDGGATAAGGGAQTAEQVEFTGTVVQTGDPVVLDDGEQTMSVETGERVQLGQEVTVRGALEDGRLDADDVF